MFLAGVIVLLLVVALAFTQVKTSQTALAVKTTISEGSVRNLQEASTDAGKVCKYELFSDGKWTSGHASILPCEKFAGENRVVE